MKKLGARKRKVEVNSIYVLLLLFSLSGILFGCGSGKESNNENVQSRLNNKELKYFSNGKQLYTQFCSNCHMENGEGLGKLIPPLKNADYLLQDVAAAARTIKFGLKGPISVNAIEYNQPMPANPDLTSLEIMEILIYISNAWGNESEVVSLPEVEAAIKGQ